MAKENKKAALSMEEQLDAALVPDWEQPYKVPANWCWTYIRTGFIVSSSKRVHKNEWQSDGVPFYRTRELVKLSEHGFVDNELFITSELYEQFKKNYGVPSPGDLLISGVGTIGVPYVIDDKRPFYFKDGNIIWFKNRGVFFPRYIYYLYKSTFMYNQLHAMSAGTTVDTYTIINAENTMLPLPPYAEQQRIVDRIESLFAKLDEAKEKAQEVVDGYDARRAAILHEAFTGELTAEWRKSKNTSLESWLTQTLKDSCSIGSGGTPSRKKPEYFDGLIPWIKTGEIDWNEIYDSEEHISQSAIDNSSAKLYPIGAVLVAMYGMGATRGRAAILNVDATTNQAVCVLQPKDYLVNRFLFYYFMCNYWDVREKAVGGNQLNLSATIIAKFVIRIPTIDEQKEIIRILDSLLLKEQQAKETAEQVIDQIDTMKKSILARAFRGELGTNDPADENAEELLKRIL